MIGYVVRHRQLGLGKVEKAQHGAFSVRFVSSGQLLPFSRAQFAAGGSLVREVLGAGSRCRTNTGDCSIERIAHRPESIDDPFLYSVLSAEGDARILSECDLQPIPGADTADPELRLGELQLHPYQLFASRENLRAAYARMLRDTAGLRALLGSRVDLRPHQAFVAGTVLQNPKRRFILADEVGLGKTIEAGIIIHDLLGNKADARILVLCPGSLTQQWLSELYSKFGGHLFTLLDLHDPAAVNWSKLRQVISSTTMAAFQIGSQLEQLKWDMVIVDEAHHLLTSSALYGLAQRLSAAAPAVLLLSAIPAHERADELLRLLALLEPDRYAEFNSVARQRFTALHEQQPQIGKGLRVLERRIDSFESGEITASDVRSVAVRILETPAVGGDLDLVDRLSTLVGVSDTASGMATSVQATTTSSNTSDRIDVELKQKRVDLAKDFRRWAYDVADRYRLSRRILRNRRQRLVEQNQIASIARTVDLRPFAAHRLELDTSEALELVLHSAHQRCAADLDAQFLAAFARIAWQAAVFPGAIDKLLVELEQATPRILNDRGVDYLTMGQAAGYADWALYTELLVRAVRRLMPDELLRESVRAAGAWRSAGPATWSRFGALRDLLTPFAPDRPKLIVFAGFPGVARQLAHQLVGVFGEAAVAAFRAEQSMEEKEANALRFQRDSAAWLLVSDETGGEGRNFQFAAEIIHVDTPWQASRIEQRIGRLDRLGREKVRPNVLSRVLYCDASVEAGLVHCLDQAVGVYRHSISGLEFALRDIEAAIVDSALSGGTNAMIALAEDLRATVARERERDDAEAVLDEASYENSAATRFAAIARSDRVDAGIEAAMTDYMRRLTEGRGVRKLDSPFGAGAVVRFQPDQTAFGALPVDSTGAEFLAGHYDGTFRRSVAQQAPRLRFFNVSDPLFNALINSLDRHVTGRVFGIEINAPGQRRWIGLECRFIPAVDALPLANSGLRSRLDALFVPKPVVVMIDLQGRLAPSQEVDSTVSLRRRVDSNKHGQNWWDLSAFERALEHALQRDAWPNTVALLVDAARREASRLLNERLSDAIAVEQARVESSLELLEEAARRGDEDASSQIADYGTFSTVVTQWHASLDAIGIVSVNGRLRHGQIE